MVFTTWPAKAGMKAAIDDVFVKMVKHTSTDVTTGILLLFKMKTIVGERS